MDNSQYLSLEISHNFGDPFLNHNSLKTSNSSSDTVVEMKSNILDECHKTAEFSENLISSQIPAINKTKKSCSSIIITNLKGVINDTCVGSIFSAIFNTLSLNYIKPNLGYTRGHLGTPAWPTYANHYHDFFAEAHRKMAISHGQVWNPTLNPTREGWNAYSAMLHDEHVAMKNAQIQSAETNVIYSSLLMGFAFATLINAKSDTSLKGRAVHLAKLITCTIGAVYLCQQAALDIDLARVLPISLVAGAVGGVAGYGFRWHIKLLS